MDCLDRTNVVQSAIARQALNLALVRMGIRLAADGLQDSSLDMTYNERKFFIYYVQSILTVT